MATNSRFTIAVHILTLLAQARGGGMKSDWVAISINTNPVVVRRIWSLLAKAELITSRTGAGGGRLARPASEITLFDVYRVVEHHPVFALHANPPNKKCLIGKNIQRTLTCIFAEAQREMEAVLARQTIADILQAVITCQS